ncbi:hypothetical protein WMY93_014349 [Mugilogobius chulae]|uniref:Fanconi anemia group D2 protein n=1 Tax=Mugilogobius chulae TaxID=88201 RepID=A0AAW0P6B2_9GOBI
MRKRRSAVDKKETSISAPSKSKKSRAIEPPEETSQSVFALFVQEAGVTLNFGDESNLIDCKRVITGLEAHIEDAERFKNSLLPCVPRTKTEDPSYSSSFHESLLRMLLGVELLQTQIINTLLEKELASKLIELVSVAPVEVQRDIITSLPEILEDSQHGDIARELNSLLQENTQLTVPILDALSSLNLSSSILIEVRTAVMATLTAVELEDLPVVVKFILHSVSASDALKVVSNLRKKLELEQCVLLSVLQDSQNRQKNKATQMHSAKAVSVNQDHITLILDGIKTAVRFQKTISEAWLKAIEAVDEPEDHKVIDLLALFILHITNSNQSRKGAERVMKNKVRSGLFRENLLQKTFKDYAQVMRVYFPSILALAQGLVRSHDPGVVPFGGHMYRHSFTAFDSYCQQEVVGALVTHVCSGVGGEVDMALELLCGLVTETPKTCPSMLFLSSPQQIRKLFHLLSSLAFGRQQQQSSHIQDDMHIVIRKQLSSTVPKYKRIGIIGAVMIIGSMGAYRSKGKESQNDSLPQETKRQLTALLELVQSSSESSPEAAALYFDELANLIVTADLDPHVQDMIGKSVLNDFQDDFVVDLSPNISGSFPLPACAMYNLDEDDSQEQIAINLLPLLAKETQHKGETKKQNEKKVSVLCLSPFFRLLRLCEEKTHKGDLEEIDALLVTPGFAPPVANFDGESVEGVVPSVTAANKGKKESTSKKRKAPGKSSSQSSQHDEPNGTEESQQEPPEKQKEKEKEVKSGASLSGFRAFFRELDFEVLNVLQCGLISCSHLNSRLNTEVREEVLLGLSELVFLLEDMLQKVEFSLHASPAKRAPFLKAKVDKSVGFSHLQQKSTKDIALSCVELLPALCSHLENCHNYFQTLLSENGGVVDGPATDFQEHQLMSQSYQLLLQILNTIFNWSGFSQPCKRSVMKKALEVLAGRLKEGETELGLEQLVKYSFEYLQNFKTSMPSLSTALCLMQLLSTVSEKGGHAAAYREQKASLARRFLNQEWVTATGEREKGTKFNETLHSLLSLYLEHVEDVLKGVEEIAGEGISELINAGKDESSAAWPTLHRQTFLVFYKVLLAVLEKSVRRIPAAKMDDNTEVQSEKLLTWNLAVRDFQILVSLVKVFDSRPVLNVALKYGRLFLESFLKLCMPLLDYSFKKHKEDVQSLLKTFQLSTRQLHHMCGHSKIRQDMSLTNHVPALKKSLELFVYRVKAMLTLNNCQEAFWMGNLKNRNLKGEEILSQKPQDSDSDEEEQPARNQDNESHESDSERTNIEDQNMTDDSD